MDKQLETHDGTKKDRGDVSGPEPVRFHAVALVCKGGDVRGRRGDVACWHLDDGYVYRGYAAPLCQSSSKRRVGLIRRCYELSAAIFDTERDSMYL